MTMAVADNATIPGWGVDNDPENDPTYPMRHIEDQGARGLNWTRPALQASTVEVLQSIEHNRRPAVVGTSTPPSGLSGMIRRVAFRRSESDWWHWLLLMGADRINVVEGVIEDLAHGTVPNIPAEMGVVAEWRHNKPGLAKKIAAAVTVAGIAYAFWARRGRAKRQDAATPITETARPSLVEGSRPGLANDGPLVSDDEAGLAKDGPITTTGLA